MTSAYIYSPESVKSALNTTLLGRRIEMHPQVGSTNDLVREAARRGKPEGLVIIAEEQLAGRGRLGRRWTAPPGCCVLCSVLLRPRFSPQHAFYLTIATSLAIYRVLRMADDGRWTTNDEAPNEIKQNKSAIHNPQSAIGIKWPNDVLIGGRKVSGVLCESEFAGGDWVYSVVGFGINANLRPGDIGDLQGTATSLSIEWGHEVNRTSLLAGVLTELESLYFALQNGRFSVIYDEWVAGLETIGKRVTVNEIDGTAIGQAVRVDSDGALVLRLDAGGEHRVLAGDVAPAER